MGTEERGLSVADARGRRLDAAAGIPAAILFVAAFVLPGKPPAPDDAIAKVVSYLIDNRDTILVSDVMIGVAAAIFLWWLGSVRSYLRSGEGGEGRLSAAAFLGGAVGVALVLAGAAAQSGLVLHLSQLTEGSIVRVGFDTYNALITMGAVGFAVFVAAASCSGARSGALPPGLYWAGSVVAGLNIASCAGLYADSGPFAAGDIVSLVAFLTLALWGIVLSVVMVRRGGVPPLPRTAP